MIVSLKFPLKCKCATCLDLRKLLSYLVVKNPCNFLSFVGPGYILRKMKKSGHSQPTLCLDFPPDKTKQFRPATRSEATSVVSPCVRGWPGTAGDWRRWRGANHWPPHGRRTRMPPAYMRRALFNHFSFPPAVGWLFRCSLIMSLDFAFVSGGLISHCISPRGLDENPPVMIDWRKDSEERRVLN